MTTVGDTNKVTIDKAEYDRLKEADRVLALLEAAGVDNWEYYGDAFRDSDDDR